MSIRWKVRTLILGTLTWVALAGADATAQENAWGYRSTGQNAIKHAGADRSLSAADLLRPIGTSSQRRPYREANQPYRAASQQAGPAIDAASARRGLAVQGPMRQRETSFRADSRAQRASAPVTPAPASRTASYRRVRASSPVTDQAGAVRQTVWMQSDTGRPMAAPLPQNRNLSMPGTGMPGIGTSTPGAANPPAGVTGTATPPNVPASAGAVPRSLPSQTNPDYAPLSRPEMADGTFATVDNCACISEPSSYTAASGLGCGSPVAYAAPPVYAPPPAAMPAPTVVPGAVAPAAPMAIAPATAAPARSLFTLGQELNPVQVGQGLWGQPVAYVPDQHVRNWLRYFSP